MFRMFLLLSVAVLAQPAIARSPVAEVICEPTSALHNKLETQFGSSRAATGIRDPEQIMEVWTDRRGNWTMVVSYSTGTSCIVAMGQDWVSTSERDPA